MYVDFFRNDERLFVVCTVQDEMTNVWREQPHSLASWKLQMVGSILSWPVFQMSIQVFQSMDSDGDRYITLEEVFPLS